LMLSINNGRLFKNIDDPTIPLIFAKTNRREQELRTEGWGLQWIYRQLRGRWITADAGRTRKRKTLAPLSNNHSKMIGRIEPVLVTNENATTVENPRVFSKLSESRHWALVRIVFGIFRQDCFVFFTDSMYNIAVCLK
jgi:hypothetical protein